MAFADLDRSQLQECPISAEACRALWCEVLSEQFRLATAPLASDTQLEIARARTWFGGRDFMMVCSLIGLDGVWVNTQVQPRIAAAVATEEAGGNTRDQHPRSRRGHA